MAEKAGFVTVVVRDMVMSSATEFDDNVRWRGDERKVDVPFESQGHQTVSYYARVQRGGLAPA